ncbi:MAG TPA: CDP-alcohol phosphatidyltransferase family protein, partial [Geminicoccaceae bacterium]|nr:CDP-alcohol phosphatidyltransferase family protein [Geminicoccaceae bacterium]
RVADGLDGALARRRGPTDLGGFLDIVLDFLIYSGFVFAFALADPAANALAAAFLIFSFVGTGGSFLAFAAMAAKRRLEMPEGTSRSLYYLGGLTEGTETILFFVLFCLFPAWFPVLATLFGALCWLTTAARIMTAWRVLR